ncbi:hypothetical protein [Thalassomonas haliotis]|uniref:Porin n=1 Tax=Thalassomonas haliotis TaxID=485448 RepID=A0ABY7VFN7_9GAMM|nr:hypothetical protein [Thalassomonas haliotis]WDE12528.1 hypothetical protein H3N35_03330 [Thalassomonas haliotis]
MKFTSLGSLALLTLAMSNSSFAVTQDELQAILAEQKQKLIEIEQQLAELKKANAEQKKQAVLAKKASTSHKQLASAEKNWWLKSYGSLLYKSEEIFRNTQDIDPDRRAKTDLERVVVELGHKFDPQWQIELELEYEHGGTGAALEYDGFEEFGEFESEIEAGGEVLVEKLEVKYTVNEDLAVKFGRIFVPVGLGTELHKPGQYFTTERHWSEATMIPQVWHENGINVSGSWNGFNAQALVTTGLNSEYFRSYRWAATGHQKRFEQVNTDDLAFTLRVDYGDLAKGTGVGISYYTGDTSGNRNNDDNIEGDGNLTLIGLHGAWQGYNWQLRGQYLYGELDDSAAITLANKTTPGLQPGNFAQVGSEAESAFFEAAYNSQSLFNLSKPLYLFAAYEYANPLKEVEQGNAGERFDIDEFAFGINYLPTPELVLKAQFARQQYAQDNLDDTNSFSLSMGYYFSL